MSVFAVIVLGLRLNASCFTSKDTFPLRSLRDLRQRQPFVLGDSDECILFGP